MQRDWAYALGSASARGGSPFACRACLCVGTISCTRSCLYIHGNGSPVGSLLAFSFRAVHVGVEAFSFVGASVEVTENKTACPKQARLLREPVRRHD